MSKTKIEFSEKAMGEINAHLDVIQGICQQAMMSGGERQAVEDVQREMYALRQAIEEQGVIVRPKAA